MYTTPKDWYERFKEAGGRGRIDKVKVWISETGPIPSAAVAIFEELRAPANPHAFSEVVAYVGARHPVLAGWSPF